MIVKVQSDGDGQVIVTDAEGNRRTLDAQEIALRIEPPFRLSGRSKFLDLLSVTSESDGGVQVEEASLQMDAEEGSFRLEQIKKTRTLPIDEQIEHQDLKAVEDALKNVEEEQEDE